MTGTHRAREVQRQEALREARQRIVELQAVRTYLEDSRNRGPLLVDLEAQVAEALAIEQALTQQGRPKPLRTRHPRVSPSSRPIGLNQRFGHANERAPKGPF